MPRMLPLLRGTLRDSGPQREDGNVAAEPRAHAAQNLPGWGRRYSDGGMGSGNNDSWRSAASENHVQVSSPLPVARLLPSLLQSRRSLNERKGNRTNIAQTCASFHYQSRPSSPVSTVPALPLACLTSGSEDYANEPSVTGRRQKHGAREFAALSDNTQNGQSRAGSPDMARRKSCTEQQVALGGEILEEADAALFEAQRTMLMLDCNRIWRRLCEEMGCEAHGSLQLRLAEATSAEANVDAALEQHNGMCPSDDADILNDELNGEESLPVFLHEMQRRRASRRVLLEQMGAA